MYILLILFFISLLGISIMIGRKLVLLKNGQALGIEKVLFEIPHLEKVKYLIVQNTKKYGHIGLVESLRFYIRSSNFLKSKYGEIKNKIKNIRTKNQSNGNPPEKAEVSKFLKMVSDYKHKIREIKHKIHEEEKNS